MAASDLPARDRVRLLEQRIQDVRAEIEQIHRAAQRGNRRDVRLAQTVADPSSGQYPDKSACPNTYWIVFLDAEYAAETQGQVAAAKIPRQDVGEPRTTVQNVLDGKDAYIPEGQIIEVDFARGQWWTLFGEGECIFFEDDFSGDLSAWDQEAGSWSISSEILGTTSENATIIADNEAPEERVVVDVDFRDTTDGVSECKVIIGWTDANNHTYAKITTSGTPGLEFRQVVSGSDSQLLQRDVLLSTNTWYHITFCYDGSKLRALVTNQDQTEHLRPAAVSASLGSGRAVGLGTGQFEIIGGGGTGGFEFDNFSAAREEGNLPKCEKCGPEICTCTRCKYDEGPRRWKIEIDGFTGGADCPTADCGKLDGTYFLDTPCDPGLSCSAGPDNFSTADGPGCFASGFGVDVCECDTTWTIELQLFVNTPIPNREGEGNKNYVMITIRHQGGTCPDAGGDPAAQPGATGLVWRWVREANVTAGDDFACFATFQAWEVFAHTADPDHDCDDLPDLGTVGEWASMCDHTTATVKIWALAN